MTTPPLDAPLLDNTDSRLARPLQPALRAARADVLGAARDLLAIPEAAMTRPWAWKGGSEEEVRYGAYRAAEALELAEIEARTLIAPDEATERQAARLIGPATAARWDLHGLLAPLDEALLDQEPGGGEWSIRLALGHTIASQRGYAWGTAWWLTQAFAPDDPSLPRRAPESFWETLPDEATTEAAGTVDDLRQRLDAILDLSAERLAGLADDTLHLGARWSGFPVTIGFRFGRWPSHLREHTIQVKRTLAMLQFVPSEPARLVRNLLSAYGRAESVVFGRIGAGEPGAAKRIETGAAEARHALRDARQAAGA